jgi:O-antigen/teichoic acid export membrane protein
MSAFLLRDAIIKQDPGVGIFRLMASVTILLGIVMFCHTLYRSSAYPKSAAVLIFVGALVYALGPMISIFVSVAGIFTLAGGCFLIGVRLFQATQG